ncbi:protein PS1 [Mycobacteroides abscessus subsp. bolletii]|nr:protein PS1 [Mycobacteroides abscessus]SKF07558.1 protein PS1 [Mycobacteroides abscessus subsp. bolletii]SKG33489.1 protein PS1 [Mycobacteroides abscessus subsp. bolletii]
MKRLVKVRHRQPVGPAATRVGAVIAAVAITGGGVAACSKDDAKDAMSTASSAASSGASAASSGLSSATSAMSSAAAAPELRYDVPGGEVILDGDVAKTFTKAGGEQKVGRLTAKPEQQGTGTVFTFENGNIYSSTATGTHLVQGEILRVYNQNGGPTGSLGYPISDEAQTNGGPQTASGGWISKFQHGEISWLNQGDGNFREAVSPK